MAGTSTIDVSRVVGGNLARLRKKTEWTQAEFGERLRSVLGEEWSRQMVWQAEKGKRRVDVEELVAFSIVLNAPLSAFFEPPPGRSVISLPSGLEASPRSLLTGFLSEKTQERLPGLVVVDAFRQYADDIRQIVQAAQSSLGDVADDLGDIDVLAEAWEKLEPRPKRRKPGRRKKK